MCQETSLLSPFGRNYNPDRRSRVAPPELSQFPALAFLILLVRGLSTSPLAFEPYIHPSNPFAPRASIASEPSSFTPSPSQVPSESSVDVAESGSPVIG